MHASIMPSLLRKLDAVLVESLVADEGTESGGVGANISALSCAFSHSRTHIVDPVTSLALQQAVRPVVSRKDCLALSEVRDHDLTPELLLLSQ